MKKIDFHIHTVVSSVDAEFTFCINKLNEYIEVAELDCIAITNHSLFDRVQFEGIVQNTDILALPGIEVDLEGGQILVVGDGSDLEDFESKCGIVQAMKEQLAPISTAKFQEIFGNLENYILIPHYEKKPALKASTIAQLKNFITAGEVSSPKKFMYSYKNDERLVPVYFSDCRIDVNLTSFPVRQTYIDCNDISFSAVKSCLRDKSKVSLSEKSGNSIFQIFDDGQVLSTGLNVIVGERSSGKSHTLRKINQKFDNVKFIEQFALVARDEKHDQERFNKVLSQKKSLFSNEYLEDLQRVVLDVMEIDLENDARSVTDYISSLIRFAEEEEKHDAFSKSVLFSEQNYPAVENKGLKDLIASTKNLVRNEEYRSVIDKHLALDALKKLYVELMLLFESQEEERLKKGWVNQVMREVKTALQTKTAAPVISEMDPYTVLMNAHKITKFDKLVKQARKPQEILRSPKGGFEIVAQVGPYNGAGELKKQSGVQVAFSGAYTDFGHPYKFLQALKKLDSAVQPVDYHKFFVKIDYKILNKDGVQASGGERSEFFLLEEIEGAEAFDMLLIDEPESSFDNIFLKQDVNKIIKEISKSMPVVLVTHNNTVGASIQPDYLLCTQKEKEDEKTVWRIYSGFPTDPKLESIDAKTVKTWDVFMGCLEGGADTYTERARNYEDIKN